ncbi:MAG: proton-conducting transporter transmembrane domain-containing protein, partial [Planctomycetota bacterium]
MRHRTMSVVIVIAAGSLIGFPPLLGFWGKLLLLIAGVKAGHLPLVVIAVINSAISAWYYLRLAGLPVLAMPGPQAETIVKRPVVWPRVAAVLTGLAVLIVPIFVERLVPDRDMTAATPERPPTPDLTLGAPPDEEPYGTHSERSESCVGLSQVCTHESAGCASLPVRATPTPVSRLRFLRPCRLESRCAGARTPSRRPPPRAA